ncbi:hypothetical protein ACHMWN_08555 [Pedobacter sp. UC225_61]|uniref:hypothetical protein n=1 Tax=Pedobacter sp. UC225_61 TaxID=3374623 RepID=UPI0037AD4648
MKKYTQKNFSMLVIACIIGVLYATYLMYDRSGGLGDTELITIGFLIGLVLLILWVVRRFMMDRAGRR